MLNNQLSLMAQFEPQLSPDRLPDCIQISNPRNCFAVLAPNPLSFRPAKPHAATAQPEFIPLSDIKTVNRVNVRKFRRNANASGAVSLLKTRPGSLVVKMGDSAGVLQRSEDVRCYLRKRTATETPAADPDGATATKRLFVVQNGDLKPILSSNIANSGVFRPSEPRHLVPTTPEPRNIIIADTIRGGIMTPQHYEEELRRAKPLQPRKVLYRVIRPTDVNLCPGVGVEALAGAAAVVGATRGRVGRRKGTLKKPPTSLHQPNAEEDPVPTARTRSGRLTRPPRHIHLDYRGNQVIMRPAAPAEVTEPEDKAEADRVAKKPRSMSWMMARLKCELCGKYYVSQQKLERHWLTHSEQPCQGSAFEHLLKQLRRVAVENRAKVFVEEVSDFVERIQFLAKRLLTDDLTFPAQLVDESAARVLAIPRGAYRFNMTALNADADPVGTPDVQLNSDCQLPEIQAALEDSCIVDPSKINLADISDDSLFQSVEDLVREKIRNLTEEDLANAVPHFESSAVDLSLELFQFQNN
ncbi:uncharacterized protein LOC132262072 [Phlebotomus argentipes]|uniref:uncharacterized protein LOC132262072 n=1 Tax=Phlebotomus argentipes TaxID=94469 RepID=UPI0028929B63|nr:uncharacterized protein LOC132262072 [Phlebotomus argentipes]